MKIKEGFTLMKAMTNEHEWSQDVGMVFGGIDGYIQNTFGLKPDKITEIWMEGVHDALYDWYHEVLPRANTMDNINWFIHERINQNFPQVTLKPTDTRASEWARDPDMVIQSLIEEIVRQTEERLCDVLTASVETLFEDFCNISRDHYGD